MSQNISQSELLNRPFNSSDSVSNYLVVHDPGNIFSISTSAQR